ncbi:MAG: hypothetical protein ACYTFK_01640, partial [Planctomycetota bacterium]
NFSDLRFVLFTGAAHPCVGIRFRPSTPDASLNIRYESPKTDIRSQQGGPVYIREEDIANLPLKAIIDAASDDKAPLIWKSHYWGSWRDRRLLSRLMGLPKLCDLAGKISENKRWIKGQGIQTSGGDDNPVWWRPSTRYLDSNTKFDLAICRHDLTTVEKAGIPTDTVHRPREKRLFAGPKVLLSKGSRKVIFYSGTVLFKDTFTAIRGNSKDEHKLRFLTAVLRSDLAYYYLFHANSNLAIYRPQTYPKEFLSIPFFLPNDASDSDKAQKIVDEVAGIIENFEKRIKTASWFGEEQRRKDEAERIRKDIEPLIREYYNIDEYETMLIEDTLQLASKSFHPKQSKRGIPTLKHPENEDCKVYAQTLCEMLNNFGRGSQFKVKGDIIKGHPYSIVHVAMTDRVCRTVPISKADDKLAEIFGRMKALLQHEQDRFVFCQNLKVFDGNSLYILKPMQMRFWSRTAALNDADEVAGSIIQSQRGH